MIGEKNENNYWLKSVPQNWEIIRCKYLFQEISDLSAKGDELLLTVSHLTGITPRSEKNVNMFFAETMEGYKKCKKGDLIINTMWAWMGAVGTTAYDGICSPAYNIYRNRKNKPYYYKYFDYLFRTDHLIKEMAINSKGIVSSRLRLYPKELYQILIPLPSLSEQIQIAQYLDTKTQNIDKTISLLTKKTSYYKELRKTLINNVVTKGLDKNVELKESGIDWIGKIPKHWEIKRLKDFGIIETSSVNKKIENDETLVKLVNYVDVYNNLTKEIIDSNDYMIVSANKLQLNSKKLKKGDVLFTPSSETIEDIGVSSVVMKDLKNTLYSYHLLRLRFKKQMNLNFKKYLFNNDFVQYYFSKSATGTTRKILGLNTFNNLPVSYPSSIEEQTKIADYLDKRTKVIDKIIANIQNQIETLKELRKSLINDVVTGKVRISKN